MGLREEGYWDEHYGSELRNYKETGDEGEVWFGRGLNRKIVEWIVNYASEQQEAKHRPVTRILDVGCGNGFTLCRIAKLWTLKGKLDIDHRLDLFGVDYSQNSIELSKEIASEQGVKNTDCFSLTFRQGNFLKLHEDLSTIDNKTFNYVIDVGTYDAICLLNSNSTSALHEAKQNYLKSLRKVSCAGKCIFILASCNNTEEELGQLFLVDKTLPHKMLAKIETPKLQFGGKEGSQVTCLIFELNQYEICGTSLESI